MKKAICFFLCIILLYLPSCQQGGFEDAVNELTAEAVQNGTTLMIYMVGSDLEAKSGAGTNDMKEILESQVDLDYNNILIYAGGAKKWHNDNVSSESGHSILHLTADGFEKLETRSEVSMGDSETLAYFLDYAYNNFSAENFSLILWDHGNGPLIGYGKDMLHENDSLTLSEMKNALESSPFSGENKLAWVGFDACLMSSIELACIWQNHADYLIASQEIEPSFGWNYAFLKELGKKDPKALAKDIATLYMDSCLEYYERRDFDERDTTLACLDLSCVDSVKTALDDLFNKATEKVDSDYSELVATRVNTRALGRATTGSEYDLIDLLDFAEKMKEHFPQESEAVVEATKNLVALNVTNAKSCCGLSIYYPFYNKSYYKKAWADVYADLNVLPSYVAYLEAYAQRWLCNDLLQTVASSKTPEIKSDSEFVLELTEEQTKHFAEAKYYILQREGNGIYTKIYTSSNVVKDKSILTANFDGNILYAKNNFDKYWIPVVDEHDTVGDNTRYSTYVNLTNAVPIYNDAPEGFKQQTAGHRFHISVNNQTKEIKTSALVPFASEVNTETLVGGKIEDADLSLWSQYYFLSERHLYLQRDENGTILPLDDWEKSSYFSANVSRIEDGVEFMFAPIPEGEYYVIFEIEDVQGNKYCSELLPIQSDGTSLPRDFYEEPSEVTWDNGEKVKLFSKDGITAYLTTIEKYDAVSYALIIENKNDFDVAILGDELMYNESISCPDAFFAYFTVPAGETVVGNSFDFGNAEDLGMLNDLKSIQFSLSVITSTGKRTIIHQKPIHIKLSQYAAGLRKDPPADSWIADTKFYQTNHSSRGLKANQQFLFEYDGVRGTILGLGGNGESDRLVINFAFENTTSTKKTIALNGVGFDKVFVNQSTGPITILPGTKIYKSYVLSEDDLDTYQITSASSVNLLVSHMQFATLLGGGGFSETKTYSIALSQRGEALTFKKGTTLLYSDSNVIIHLENTETVYDGYKWTCTISNICDTDLMLSSVEIRLNGNVVNTDDLFAPVLAPYDDRCPVGYSTVFDIKYIGDITDDLNITFKPQFYDLAGEQLLYTGTKIVLEK